MHRNRQTAAEALLELEPILPADWPNFGEVVRQVEKS